MPALAYTPAFYVAATVRIEDRKRRIVETMPLQYLVPIQNGATPLAPDRAAPSDLTPDAYYAATNEDTYDAYAFNRNAMLQGQPAGYIKFAGETNLLLFGLAVGLVLVLLAVQRGSAWLLSRFNAQPKP